MYHLGSRTQVDPRTVKLASIVLSGSWKAHSGIDKTIVDRGYWSDARRSQIWGAEAGPMPV